MLFRSSMGTSAMRLWLKSTVSSRPVLDDLGGVFDSSLSEEAEPADLMRWCEGALTRGMPDLEAGPCDWESDMGFDAERRERMWRRRACGAIGGSTTLVDMLWEREVLAVERLLIEDDAVGTEDNEAEAEGVWE